jgi:phosphomannomutase/phosphoglucomutase
MKINPVVFREYDVRGKVDSELSNDFAHTLGRAYGAMCRARGVTPDAGAIGVGHDCRLSSPGYASSLARGINEMGFDVAFSGMGPTPQLYFSVFTNNFAGGIQVTGSHNPPDMNGFKILIGTQTISGQDIKDLRRFCENSPSFSPNQKLGTTYEIQVRQKYIDYLVDNSKPEMGSRRLKVVVDGGNGVGGLVGPEVLRRLGLEVIELYCEPDGRFPNHHPDPTELKNIQDLIAAVKLHNADFGIGWDGDADRIGAVDERGDVVFGDMLVLLYAREIIKKVKNPTIIGDVKCSSLLFSDLKARGANAVMWKTGHSLIKNKLKETQGELAGEMSGHIFFKHRFFGFDDALYASSRLAEILSHHDGPLSSLLSDLPKMVSTPEIRVDCSEDLKFKIAQEAQSAFNEFTVDTTNGVRVTFEKGWGLVRASNTQPILVMRFEAESQKLLDEYQTIVTNRIEMIKSRLSA